MSERPLSIRAPVQDGYLSVSGFAADTSNFFAINDSALPRGADGRKQLDLVLSRDGKWNGTGAVRIITAPSGRGLILFRSLIADEAQLARLQRDFQARQQCDPS